MHQATLMVFLILCLLLQLLVETKTSWLSSETCPKIDQHPLTTRNIGVVIDERCRVGKEQKIAMEMAAHDFQHCSNLVLHFKDSHGNRSASAGDDIKTFVSKVVTIVWLGIVIVMAASFTAVLSTNMTVPRLQPSIVDVDFLRKTNAAVGCNGNSFIVRYLVNVLKFKTQNVRKINSIDEYPEAFKRGEIKAAFFVAPHAKVFLAQYCDEYVMSGSRYTLGGFGFVFPKGSQLANNFSEAILKVTQSGVVNKLEKQMLSSFSSCSNSSSPKPPDPRIDWKLFCILAAIHFAIIIYLLKKYWNGIKAMLHKAFTFIGVILSGVGTPFLRGIFNSIVPAAPNVSNHVAVQLTANS